MISGRGTTRAEDAQGTPAQSYMSPSLLICEESRRVHVRRYSAGSSAPAYYLRILVYLVIYDYGQVSLEHLKVSLGRRDSRGEESGSERDRERERERAREREREREGVTLLKCNNFNFNLV